MNAVRPFLLFVLGMRNMIEHPAPFLDGDWPTDMAAEAIRLEYQVDDATRAGHSAALARKLFNRLISR